LSLIFSNGTIRGGPGFRTFGYQAALPLAGWLRLLALAPMADAFLSRCRGRSMATDAPATARRSVH
jgi:hypothetical protein